ncbi:MAG: CDP-alcohol phosphatidyltransferase family protein [Pseudomonadota bacterium]
MRPNTVTLPNLITLARLFMVPLIVWALLSEQMGMAFAVFVIAGISDAVDGTIARYFNQQSAFGTVLDPIADKIMLVSVFVGLTYLGHIPLWLTIMVVSRDLLIINGVMLAFVMAHDVEIKPLAVSKANTVAQIGLAALVLGLLAFDLTAPTLVISLQWLTALLTGASALAYVWAGLKVFSAAEGAGMGQTGTLSVKLDEQADTPHLKQSVENAERKPSV